MCVNTRVCVLRLDRQDRRRSGRPRSQGRKNVLKCTEEKNKAEYTATLVAYGWAGAVLEKELYAQKAKKTLKK